MMKNVGNKIYYFEAGLLKYFREKGISLNDGGKQKPDKDIILKIEYIPEGLTKKTTDTYHLRFIGDYPLQKEPYADQEKRGICIKKEGLHNHPQFMQFKDILDLLIMEGEEEVPIHSIQK